MVNIIASQDDNKNLTLSYHRLDIFHFIRVSKYVLEDLFKE